MEGITLRILMLAWAGTLVLALPVSQGESRHERQYHGLTSDEKGAVMDQDLGLSYEDRQPLSLRLGGYKRNNEDSASRQLADEIHDRGIENMLKTQRENQLVKRSLEHVENKEGTTETRRRSQMTEKKKRHIIKHAGDTKANGQQSDIPCQPQSPDGKQAQQSGRDCVPQSPEALKVWAEGKQAMLDQLREQMKMDVSAVEDERAAIITVQKCLQSAAASGLEGRQQAKIINLLSRNSKVLIGHIDIVEGVATEELAQTGGRLVKFQDKLEHIKSRIAEVENELGCGSGRPQNRNRRVSDNPDAQNMDEPNMDEPKERLTDDADAPLSKMHRAATEIADMLSKTGPKRRQFQQEADRVKRDDQFAGDEAQQAGVEDKRALGKEAQQVWLEGKRALVEQLKEQLKANTVAVDDEGSATSSVKKCLQSAVAAGLEARQQGKIIKLLGKNSAEMIGHIDSVEGVASDELAGTVARLARFEAKLQEMRDRIAASEQDLRAAHGCGQAPPPCNQRLSEEESKELLPLENVAVKKRHASFNTGTSQETCKQRLQEKQQRMAEKQPYYS